MYNEILYGMAVLYMAIWLLKTVHLSDFSDTISDYKQCCNKYFQWCLL